MLKLKVILKVVLKVVLTAFLAVETVGISRRLSSKLVIHYGLAAHFSVMLLVGLLEVYLRKASKTTVRWVRNVLLVYLATTLGMFVGVLINVLQVYYKIKTTTTPPP